MALQVHQASSCRQQYVMKLVGVFPCINCTIQWYCLVKCKIELSFNGLFLKLLLELQYVVCNCRLFVRSLHVKWPRYYLDNVIPETKHFHLNYNVLLSYIYLILVYHLIKISHKQMNIKKNIYAHMERHEGMANVIVNTYRATYIMAIIIRISNK